VTAEPAPGAPRAPARFGRRAVLVVASLALLLLAAGAVLAVFRYLPAVNDARALRADLETMVDRVRETGMEIDRGTIDALDADLHSARERLDRLESLLAGDPLVALGRVLPPTSPSVVGADLVVTAAGDLLGAVGDGLAIGRRFVEIREAQATDPAGGSLLARLVELMATSRDRAVSAAASVAGARRALDAVPDGAVSQVVSVRDAMMKRIDTYGPLLDSYADASDRMPAILGWDGPRRYLVLTQDPAEIRPTGGFTGSYGIVKIDRGRITERSFQDVARLDLPWDYPRIEPPRALTDYLLGPEQPWQFADANWSPDYPTSAGDALRLYANETGDSRFDGVIAMTTYTIDELLKVTGPVTVPAYDATIAPGETTLRILQLTRVESTPGEDRKAILPAFADALLAALLDLPPEDWPDLLGTVDTLRREHLFLAWFPDPADQALAVRSGFAGAVRSDPGDYVYPVDTNVAPATKLDYLATRSWDLDVEIDAVGNAQNRLEVTWHNGVEEPEWEAYRAMSNIGGELLGVYFRLLVPERSRVEEVAGGGLAPVSAPATVESEAGRTVIGTYLKIPPGSASLRTAWTSPYAAEADDAGGAYRLTIQKQPGITPGPLTLHIRVPDGYRISAASPELTVDGATATLATMFGEDVVVALRYER
jgi:hypothetical protein